MHFEILVEDQPGKLTLGNLLQKILIQNHTVSIYAYKGIGRIPQRMLSHQNASRRILLQQLPRLLNKYGKTFSSHPPECPAVVIVVCDLDDKCLHELKKGLNEIVTHCQTPPATRFCFAIEEGEARILGDIPAIKSAYPKADTNVLTKYKNDSIRRTWEKLADAVYPGGAI